MTHSPDAHHAQSLNLLQDVIDYLNRLPVVPTTTELRRRIEQHLQAPENALIQRSYASAGLQFKAGAYTAAGFPLLEARVLVPTSVWIKSAIPEEPNFQAEHKAQLLKLLYDGASLKLSPES